MASEEAKKAAQKEVEKRLAPMMRALNTVREVNDKGRQALKAWADSKTRPAPAATDTGLVTVGHMVSHDAELGPVEDAVVYRSQAVELLAAERAEKEELEADNAELVADYDFMRKSRKKWKERAQALEADNAAQAARIKELGARLFDAANAEPGEHQEILDALEAHNSGEEQ